MNKYALVLLLGIVMIASTISISFSEAILPEAESLPVIENFDGSSDKFVPGQIIVGLKNGPDSVDNAIKSKGGKILDKNDILNTLLIKVPNKTEDVFIEAIKNNPNVSFAVKNHVVTMTSNDPYWGDQWDMRIIQADDAWNTVLGSSAVTVAVLDTGVEYTHYDLVDRVTAGADFSDDGDGDDPMDRKGHGTHVAGTIGATINNGIGIAGLAQVEILAVQVLNDGGSGSDWSVSHGITFAAEYGADIINLSLGCACEAFQLPATRDALALAYSNYNVLIVAAAGNDGSSGPHYPSDDPNAISVSATSKDDTIASYSNWGDNIELAAPGGDKGGGPYWKTYVLSTYLNNGYAYATGTSMASPHVAGVAALVLAVNPGLSNDDLRAHLQNTSDDLGDAGKDQFYGYGRVNAQSAVETSLSPNDKPTAEANGPYDGTEDVSVSFNGTGSSDPDGDPLTYSWDFGDSSTGTGVTPNHTYRWGGIFDIVLTVSDGNGGTATDTSTATIDEVNDAPVADPNGPYSGTVGEAITFDGSGSSDYDNEDGNPDNNQTLTYSWDFRDGGTSTEISPSHTYSEVDDYVVLLTVSDGPESHTAETIAKVTEVSEGVTVTLIDPNSVGVDDTVDVKINGTGFVSGASVTLSNGSGPTPIVSDVLVVDGDTITATITTKSGGPPRDRVWDVTVTNPDGTSGTLVDGFTVTVTSTQNGNSKAK